MVKMKDSGIEWVGQIPINWQVMSNKYVMSKIKDICPIYKGQDILSLTINGVIIRDLDAGGKMPTTFDGYQKLYPNNLLMCLFDYDVTPRCIGLIKNNGLTSPAYSQFIMKNNNSSRYYYYYYLMIDTTKELLHLAKNLRHSFTEEQLGAIKTPVPPIEEQEKIADFLDSKCSEIDAISAEIQEQIITLEEYKKSVITEAVTKGLDPNTEMKDSGIEWIGQIPINFETKKIKYIGEFRNGLTYSPTEMVDEQNGILVLRSSNIKNGKLSLSDNVYVSTYIKPQLFVKAGDILICSRNGSRELIGKNALIENDLFASFGAFMMILRCSCPKYIYYILNSNIFTYYLGTFFTSTINQLTGNNFGNMKIVICQDKTVQDKIVSYLDSKCTEIDSAIEDKQKQLETLEEYKKTMIYEYVTGKKEVV